MALVSATGNAFAADSVGPWEVSRLYEAPDVTSTAEFEQPGVQSLFYEGLEWKGSPTRVYAYYCTPEGEPPAGGWPGVVCVHGGGGTAFHEWVSLWAGHGYAAISMDLEGHLPDPGAPRGGRPSFERAGPQRIGQWEDAAEPVEEQWFYHAVAQVVLAHSLLRARPEVDPERTGITGISWGGILTSAVAGVDDRFKFAVPVYGCGFLHESDGVLTFDRAPAEHRQTAIARWDPSNVLPRATLPMLWVNGTNDKHFPLDVWSRSAERTKGPHILRAEIRMAHGHGRGWAPDGIYAFADSIVKGGTPLPNPGNLRREGRTVSLEVASTTDLRQAELCYTEDLGTRQHRYWQSVPATVAGRTVTAELPEHATCFFVNVTDERGLMVSSGYRELPADEIVRAPVAPPKQDIPFEDRFRAAIQPGDGVRIVRAENFEDRTEGAVLSGTVVEDPGGEGGMRVAEGCAASGSKALKITDSGTCKHAWMPSLQTWFRGDETVRGGRCTVAFDLMQPRDRRAALTLMVRDYEAEPYHEALKVTCGANGTVRLGGKAVRIRPGVWHHVEVVFPIGPDSSEPARFTVHTADDPPRSFDVPLKKRRLDTLGWIGFCAADRQSGTCFLDNLVIRLHP